MMQSSSGKTKGCEASHTPLLVIVYQLVDFYHKRVSRHP